MERELKRLNRRLPNIHRKLRLLVDSPNADISVRLSELNEELRIAEARKVELLRELEHSSDHLPGKDAAIEAFSDFDRIWDTLNPTEQQHVLNLLVERIDYDGTPENQRVSITYRDISDGNPLLQAAQ